MSNDALQALIGSWFPEPEADKLQCSTEGSQYLTISLDPAYLSGLMERLKSSPETQFDYLFCLTGVDWGKELGVVYHLESTTHRHILVVKVQTADREEPCFDSVSHLWPTANFHEREVFDFFGIRFRNHPNLKKLFLTDEWEGYPLRKDYTDEVNMIVK
ncbi:NADH-quinone oxidoreductase subunit C [Cesiribacter andamanensis]|uniref:NADH-quinone oxidoreductase chain 5 n=1 Tax=Cesiribacter andamanensis AMV16 TaxID=1279009 RepID=M7N7W6_9BACT|nr:NADH-quinone oxidoreductase subunit C [Cesiribacter andamanensis]EMR03296.1 NADH-quinone oxidoreductase chain 5 [Cesiribacter andamanensis AMV16]